MRIAPWNSGLFDILSLEIIFDDGSRKTWDYDALYFSSLNQVKNNMAADFGEPLTNCKNVTIYAKVGDEFHSGTFKLPKATGLDFSEFVFNQLGTIE